MSLSLLYRYAVFTFCVLFTLLSLPVAFSHPWLWMVTLLTGALSLVGINDLRQKPQAIRRNYPASKPDIETTLPTSRP